MSVMKKNDFDVYDMNDEKDSIIFLSQKILDKL